MTHLELIQRHVADTGFCSVQHHMRTASTTYAQILALNRAIVPAILKYLRDHEGGMNVMLLLWDILQLSPYQPAEIKGAAGETVPGFVGFKVEEARQAWLAWGVKERLI